VHLEVVLRLEELQERALHLAIRHPARDGHRLHADGIEARVVHAGRDVHGRGDEVLHLARAIAVALQVEREVDHRLYRRARLIIESMLPALTP
jgi:hypothetical protein